MQQRLTRKLTLLFAAASLAFLAACDHEAGQNLDEGNFGTPTEINTLAMTGQATAALQKRFEVEVPTTINFPFDSSQITPEASFTNDLGDASRLIWSRYGATRAKRNRPSALPSIQ